MTRRRWPRRVLCLSGLLLLAGACYVSYRQVPRSVAVALETAEIRSPGDAADDPCVWVAPDDPARSLILGTDKKGGLAAYDLDGREIQYLEVGKLNNVDLRPDFPFADGPGAIVAATNKSENRIDLFRIRRGPEPLVPFSSIPVPAGFLVDGMCLYRSARSGEFQVVVTTKAGEFGQWRLLTGDRSGDGELLRRVVIGSESEGCVADDELGWLYVAEENVGIWKYPADPDAGEQRRLIDSTGLLGRLRHDVEGLAIYKSEGGTGYLVASNQGRDDFLAYTREGDNDYAGRFRLVAEGDVDGVTHSDGIEIVSQPLGPRFPHGVLIVQDDENGSGHQNFKLVAWENVAAAFHRLF